MSTAVCVVSASVWSVRNVWTPSRSAPSACSVFGAVSCEAESESSSPQPAIRAAATAQMASR